MIQALIDLLLNWCLFFDGLAPLGKAVVALVCFSAGLLLLAVLHARDGEEL